MKLFNPHTIQLKLVHMTLIFTLIITLLIVSICYTSFHTLLRNSLIESTNSNLRLIMNALSSNIEPIIDFSNWCSNKTILATYLTSNENPDSSSAYSTWMQLKEEYLNNASARYINRVVIGNDASHYLHVSSITSFNAFNMVSTITSLPYFETLYESDTPIWVGIVSNPFSDQKGEQMLPIIRPIYSKYNNTKIGWCYLAVSTNLFTHTLSKDTIPADSTLLLTIGEHTYDLLSPDLEEIFDIPLTTKPLPKGGTLVTNTKDTSGKEQTYITISSSSLDDWYLTQSLSQTEFKNQRRTYLLLLLFIGLIILAIGTTLTLYLDKLINHPLNKVLHKMNLIAKGDFSYDPSIEWDNEFGEIGKGINHLSANVSELMETRIAAEKHEKELEYQMLQSQINPHFLYNTLNSIKWMATIQQATGIAEMTTALSRLMLAVSKDTKQIVSLREELDLLDNYFLIQQYRYGGTISLQYEIDDILKNCEVLKFTLQPIVENAIFHGIEPKGEAGCITIKAYQSTTSEGQKDLHIDITDNGIGMTKEQMQTLLSKETGSEFFKKIGIHNVHQRILYTYGPHYGLSLSSEVGCYTTVSILLPYHDLSYKEDLC